MAAAPPLGAAVIRLQAGLAAAMLLAGALPAAAAERYALIVTGASGGPQYEQKYQGWRQRFVTILREQFGYPEDHVIVLAEQETEGVAAATAEQVRAALARLRKEATAEDVVLVLLIGHGTGFLGEEAKFNLVGPDLTADEWGRLIAPIAGRVVFVNTTSASFPFLQKIAGRGRIVLTATDSVAQQFETVFPEYFIRAFADAAADLDKNQKVSMWEAFTYASAGVRSWFDEQGKLPTERPLLDDTGDGVSVSQERAATADGELSKATYLQPDSVVGPTGDPILTSLLQRRAELQAKIEALRANRPYMSAPQYELQLEQLLLDLARVDREIRSKS